MVNINMIHISPWAATQGLMTGASRLLPVGGSLFLYGPYIEPGIETTPTNLLFDLDLKARDPAWGLRRLDEVTALAAQYGLELSERLSLPANNLGLIFRKTLINNVASYFFEAAVPMTLRRPKHPLNSPKEMSNNAG
jgi:hypothetical protein